MSSVRVYYERGPRTADYKTLGDSDEIHMRFEEDREDVRILGRLYITSSGIRWYPKGVKDPQNPNDFALSWSQLSDVVGLHSGPPHDSKV